jgi:DNA-directed RNA polymerase specialized sigma24 family protein
MLRQIPLSELASHCRDQTQRFVRGETTDDRYCLEIFQRAIVDREDAAWSAVLAQYSGIVLAYVSQHTAASNMEHSQDYWINRAFQRFWSAVGPDRFGQFPDLASLLKYLKLCVHSVILDEVRARRARVAVSLDEVPETFSTTASAERSVLNEVSREQLWTAVLDEVSDEAEYQVTYLAFVRDLKPGEIYDRRPELFESVADVYRIKRNVLQRLRRSPRMQEFLTA